MENNLVELKQKIEKLVRLYEVSLTLNKSLTSKLEQVEQENTSLKEQISLLNTSTNALKLTTFANTLSENERVELKKTINEYIKEIDFCIKTLDQ